MEKTKVDKFKEMMKGKKPSDVSGQQSVKPTSDESRATSDESRATSDEFALQLKAAEDEAKAHYDKLLRVMAEFENFKKRIERERAEHLKYSCQSVVIGILPVLDDLDRVLEHIPGEAVTEVLAIADGVKIIQNHLLAALSKHGLSALEPSAGKPFDPNVHEAVSYIESNEQEANSVIVEHRRGYKLHDRVIRPASVTVAKERKQDA